MSAGSGSRILRLAVAFIPFQQLRLLSSARPCALGLALALSMGPPRVVGSLLKRHLRVPYVIRADDDGRAIEWWPRNREDYTEACRLLEHLALDGSELRRLARRASIPLEVSNRSGPQTAGWVRRIDFDQLYRELERLAANGHA